MGLSNVLEVRLFGQFDLRRDGKPISIASRPAQSLFAYLILSAGTAHRREKLAGLLWPDSLEETARDNLRHALWRVRKALQSASSVSCLQANDLTIAFNASAEYWFDVAALEKMEESASAGELIAALSHYQGELLPGFYDEWVALEREHLSSIYEHNMARLMSLLQDESRWLDILDWGERWIKLGQKPEPAYRALMMAHAAKGDMSKVAATYERCIKSLHEYGIEPSEQTKELYKNLKSGRESPKTVSLSKKPVAEQASSNIPVPLTSFVGRQDELNEIAKLLSSSRLVTLTGPGGVGKTRLAIQTAHDLSKEYKDGVFWVGLVGLSDENLIPQEIAQALNIREVTNEPIIETLKTHLNSKDVMLVIDNCEHLINGCAQTTEFLLTACPNLKILATSTEALGLFDETIWRVPSLPLPEMRQEFSPSELREFASIELFNERAAHAKSGFVLDKRNASSIAQICLRLDGIPLAIELASARVRMMTVEEIASHLDDRFDLLTGGNRTALPRHQTLRATIDWSYELLTGPERILFRRLSIFAGGFTLDAAETVCSFGELKRSESIDLLGRLVDKSLVIVESTPVLNETRYRLLETIREYARMKLEEAGELVDMMERHLEYFAAFASLAGKGINSLEQVAWFQRLDNEVDNLRAAMNWPILKNGLHLHLMQKNQFLIVGSLDIYWESRNRNETIQALRRMLALDESGEPMLEKAKALKVGGFLLWSLNSLSEAHAFLEESIQIAGELSDKATLALSLTFLGWICVSLGEYEKSKTYLEESVAIARSLGEEGKHIAGQALSTLGDIPYWQGDLVEARKLYEEAISFLRQLGDINRMGSPLRRLAYIEIHEENFVQAAHLFGESLELNLEVGHLQGQIACLAGFGALNLAKKNLEKAAMFCGCVENLIQRFGGPFFFADTVEYERSVSELKKTFEETELSVAWSKGRAMALEEGIDFALIEFKS